MKQRQRISETEARRGREDVDLHRVVGGEEERRGEGLADR